MYKNKGILIEVYFYRPLLDTVMHATSATVNAYLARRYGCLRDTAGTVIAIWLFAAKHDMEDEGANTQSSYRSYKAC